MKNEDKETIYWLFNTAVLWANSGIEVKEGDELTIRASGASFTAIHHLVESSVKNNFPQDKWVGTDGQEKKNKRDSLRAQYRIDKNSDEGILLMQVIPAKYQNNCENWIDRPGIDTMFLTNGNIEVIGKERRNLRISQNGILHFAVNDIVLTDTILYMMYKENLTYRKDSLISQFDTIMSMFNKIGKSLSASDYELYVRNIVADSLICRFANHSDLDLGSYPGRCKKTPIMNELVYYKEKGFKTPWYMDNLGSFLIVIERKR